MAQAGFKTHGFRELGVLLARLPDESKKKAVRPSLRDSAHRFHEMVIRAFSGSPIGIVTGAILYELVVGKVRSVSKRGVIRYSTPQPRNKQDAIAVNALEYGWVDRYGNRHHGIGKIRSGTDENAGRELAMISGQIARNIEKQARKLGMLK